jgi:tetratricopeptide (TPR) repeat protein
VSLCLFVGLLYANAAGNGFALDDTALVRDNPLIRGLGEVPTLFASDYWEPEAKVGLYRPLVTTSYALNFALGGREPRGYHLANLGLHALVCVLVWALYQRLSGDALTVGAAAFLFAAHAVHTEAVANVVGRAELLGALFFLLSFLAYLRARNAQGRRLAGLYAASLGAYLLALLSKESAVTLLGVIPLYDLVYGAERAGRSRLRLSGVAGRWRVYGGFLLVTLVYLAVRSLALGSTLGLPQPARLDNPLVTLDLPWRLLNALQVALRYLGLLFFPVHLSYDYSYNQIPLLTSLADPRAALVLGLSAVAVGIVVWSYRVCKQLLFALGFYCATFSVVSNLVVPIGTIMGERLVYLPSVGFCLAGVLVLRGLCGRLPVAPSTARAVFIGVMVLGVGLHSGRTFVRNADWKSEERLYLHDVQVVPGSAKALNNAGKTLQDLGRHSAAIAKFEEAIEVDPTYPTPSINWAYSLSALGRDAQAIKLLDHQIRRGSRDPFVYNNLGFLLVDREIEVKRGVALLQHAVEQRPNDADFLDSLGWGYYKLGRLEEARQLLEGSLELNDWSPSSADRRAHLETIEQALRRR